MYYLLCPLRGPVGLLATASGGHVWKPEVNLRRQSSDTVQLVLIFNYSLKMLFMYIMYLNHAHPSFPLLIPSGTPLSPPITSPSQLHVFIDNYHF